MRAIIRKYSGITPVRRQKVLKPIMKTYNRTRKSRTRKGFTLIELLVVVLILAILMAVSIPLYLSAVSDSQKKTCRANMQTISNSVAAARVKSNALNYSSYFGAIDTAKEADLSSIPTCPSSGTYSIAAGAVAANFKVACTIGTHGSFEPGKDSN